MGGGVAAVVGRLSKCPPRPVHDVVKVVAKHENKLDVALT